jgi:hypothetical protein
VIEWVIVVLLQVNNFQVISRRLSFDDDDDDDDDDDAGDDDDDDDDDDGDDDDGSGVGSPRCLKSAYKHHMIKTFN